jgi:hypothetical protein
MNIINVECPVCKNRTDLDYKEWSVDGKCSNCGSDLYAELDTENKIALCWKVHVFPKVDVILDRGTD